MDGDAAARALPWEERNADIKADTKEIIATEERGGAEAGRDLLVGGDDEAEKRAFEARLCVRASAP